jgi:C_GCAxxG_C_C family probable redox protein
MNRPEIAVNKFKEGYNCAQSMLFSYSDKLNISKDLALKLGTGFGGGMGRKQEVCGAVSGAIIVLNLLYGRGENEDKQKQERTYAKVRELIDKFEAKYGTVNCKKLLGGCELLTPEGQEQFKSEKKNEKCYEYVDYIVKILEEITQEEKR